MITKVRHEVYSEKLATLSIHITELEGYRLQRFIRHYNLSKAEYTFFPNLEDWLFQLEGEQDEIGKAYKEIIGEFVHCQELTIRELNRIKELQTNN